MALLVPNVGEVIALKAFLNHTASENQKLDLYTGNVTPAETDTHSSYTAATGGGYAQASLTGSSWSVSAGAPSSATYAQQTFTFTGAPSVGTMYGYFVTMASAGTLMWAERFSAGPYTMANNGDNIKITPAITCD